LGHGIPLLDGLELVKEVSRPVRYESGRLAAIVRRGKSPGISCRINSGVLEKQG
jgi:hypothetical protein